MSTSIRQGESSRQPGSSGKKLSKKEQILALYAAGFTDVEDLAMIAQARPSYVAATLQGEEKLPAYFDLYTSSAQPMNVYSKHFAGKLGFKDEAAARQSIEHIDHLYRHFELAGDRAGQHHALVMALTMFDRARWTNKQREADVFREWLSSRLNELDGSEGMAEEGKPPPKG